MKVIEDPKVNNLLFQSIDAFETSIIHCFEVSDQFIDIINEMDNSVEEEQHLYELLFFTKTFYNKLIELQKLLLEKRTLLVYEKGRADKEAQLTMIINKFKEHDASLQLTIEKTIRKIQTKSFFKKEYYIFKNQLEDLIHYHRNKERMLQALIETSYPDPAPPFLKVKPIKKYKFKKADPKGH